mgnify:CR=1 FL=1
MRPSQAVIAYSVILFSVLPSRAQEIVTSVTRDQVATILRDSGYRAEIIPNPSSPNGAHIRTGISGRNVLVAFFNCTADNCAAVQFWTGFGKSPKHTPTLVEKWNSEIRYAKAHLTSDGGMHLEFDIFLGGGVSSSYLKSAIALYGNLLSRLDEFVKAAPPAFESGARDKTSTIEALAAQGRFTEAIAALDDTAASLWEKAPLTFRRALWVAAPPEGFGVYNPRENNVYASGVPMIAYAEPVGFAWRQSGDVHQTDLAIDIVVKDKNGVELLRQSNFGEMKQASRVRNREFMTRFTYRLGGFPPGEYVLDTIMRDKVSEKTGTFSLPFVVR